MEGNRILYIKISEQFVFVSGNRNPESREYATKKTYEKLMDTFTSQVKGCTEVMREVANLLQKVVYGNIIYEELCGTLIINLVFVNHSKINIVGFRDGSGFNYLVNKEHKLDRTYLIEKLKSIVPSLETVSGQNETNSSAENYKLFTKLCNYAQYVNANTALLYEDLTCGGSEDRWSRSGEQLIVVYDNLGKLFFIIKDIHESSKYGDRSTQEIKEYRKDISLKEVKELCKKHKLVLDI